MSQALAWLDLIVPLRSFHHRRLCASHPIALIDIFRLESAQRNDKVKPCQCLSNRSNHPFRHPQILRRRASVQPAGLRRENKARCNQRGEIKEGSETGEFDAQIDPFANPLIPEVIVFDPVLIARRLSEFDQPKIEFEEILSCEVFGGISAMIKRFGR